MPQAMAERSTELQPEDLHGAFLRLRQGGRRFSRVAAGLELVAATVAAAAAVGLIPIGSTAYIPALLVALGSLALAVRGHAQSLHELGYEFKRVSLTAHVASGFGPNAVEASRLWSAIPATISWLTRESVGKSIASYYEDSLDTSLAPSHQFFLCTIESAHYSAANMRRAARLRTVLAAAAVVCALAALAWLAGANDPTINRSKIMELVFGVGLAHVALRSVELARSTRSGATALSRVYERLVDRSCILSSCRAPVTEYYIVQAQCPFIPEQLFKRHAPHDRQAWLMLKTHILSALRSAPKIEDEA